MREALHIFLKDSRYLRLPIAVVIGWLALFVYANVATHRLPGIQFPTGPWEIFLQYSFVGLALGWTFLIAQAVHADGPQGDRQFWLSRPHRQRNLMLAKALFVLAYVTLPFAMAQVAIFAWLGLPVGPFLTGIAFTQLMWLAVAFVPVAAVATLTSNLPQMLLLALAFPLISAAEMQRDLGQLTWISRSLFVAIAGCVATLVVCLQYVRRQRPVALLVTLVGILAGYGAAHAIAWDGAYGLQTRWHGGAPLALSSALQDPTPRSPEAVVIQPLQIQLPFSIEGLPPGIFVRCEATQVSFTAADGSRRQFPLHIVQTRTMTEASRGCSSFLGSATGIAPSLAAPVTIEATMYASVYGETSWTNIGVNRDFVAVPDVGACRARDWSEQRGVAHVQVECYTGMRTPGVLVEFAPTPSSANMVLSLPNYSAWPGDLLLAPVRPTASMFVPADDAWIGTRAIRSHARLQVRRENVDLNAYVITRTR